MRKSGRMHGLILTYSGAVSAETCSEVGQNLLLIDVLKAIQVRASACSTGQVHASNRLLLVRLTLSTCLFTVDLGAAQFSLETL